MRELRHPVEILVVAEAQPRPPEPPPGQLVQHGAGVRILVVGLAEEFVGEFGVLAGAPRHMPAAAQHQLPRFETLPRHLEGARLLDAIDLLFQD